MHASAEKPGLEFLVCRQRHAVGVGHVDRRLPVQRRRLRAVVTRAYTVAGHRAGHQPAVIAPVEAQPRAALPRLVLNVGGRVKSLVVVDTEDTRRRRGSGSGSADLGSKEARSHAGERERGGESVEVGHADATHESGNLRVVPLDREGDRRVAQHAEVVGVVRVLPDVLTGENQILAEGLLKADVKFIAPARTQRSAEGVGAAEQRVENRVAASDAREHQVLIEGGFQNTRVGGAKNCVGLLDVVCDAEARLGFGWGGQTVVKVASNSKIERPLVFS